MSCEDFPKETEYKTKDVSILVRTVSSEKKYFMTFQGFQTQLLATGEELPYYMYNSLKDYNCIYVKDNSQIWYSLYYNSTLRFLRKILVELGNPSVVCIGQSAGGYAAILYGNLLRVKKVISLSPQIEIFVSFLNPHRKKLIKKYNLKNYRFANLTTIQPFAVPTVIMVGDLNTHDKKSVDLLDKEDPNLTIQYIDTNSHNIIPTIGKKELLEMIIKENHTLTH